MLAAKLSINYRTRELNQQLVEYRMEEMILCSHQIVNIALKGIALAMGIAVVVLSFINELETRSAVSMLGIGLACLALVQFSQKNDI